MNPFNLKSPKHLSLDIYTEQAALDFLVTDSRTEHLDPTRQKAHYVNKHHSKSMKRKFTNCYSFRQFPLVKCQ